MQKMINLKYFSSLGIVTLNKVLSSENEIEKVVNEGEDNKEYTKENISRLHIPTRYSCEYKNQKCFTTFDGKYIDDLDESVTKSYTSCKNIIQDILAMLDTIAHDNETMTKNTQALLLHIVDELDRNVRNHSELDEDDEMCYSAAYFKQKNRMNFTICDEGIGFVESLKSKCLEKGSDLIKKSLEAGVTAQSNHGFCLEESGKNSGYGLYILSEIVKKCDGILYISSKGVHYKLDNLIELDNGTQFSINKNIEMYEQLCDEMNPHTLIYFDLDVSKMVSQAVQDFLKNEISGGQSVSNKSQSYLYYPTK